MKRLCVFWLLSLSGVVAFADTVHVILEINGVAVHGGQLYGAVYSNEDEYKNERYFDSFLLESSDTTIRYELDLPTGDYVIVIYQDTNDNGTLDKGLFGIPKEPFGFTNYSRGIPGNFRRLKTPVNAEVKAITVNIGKYRM
ncbi:MAG: DUF2141 domain-containing protein [Treponema sp.]|jgi:uncharacterized protein (DUF2141 family)|nr:DUF2141 domain-containing protein [Treponema sp.]